MSAPPVTISSGGFFPSVSKLVCGIVHIINHTVHILWEEVMIFTDKRGMVLDFGFPQEVNNQHWARLDWAIWAGTSENPGGQIRSTLFFYLGGLLGGGGLFLCNRQNQGTCTNYHAGQNCSPD